MANEIVIVGAGPIGLWTAIQIKLRNPDIDIVLKEKYAQYQRLHTLKLEHTAFDGCHKDESGVIDGMITELKANPHMRTDILEGRLLTLAKRLGIRVDHQHIESMSDVTKAHPDAAMIIGADGVRSSVRGQVFGENNVHKTPLAYAAQIKYFVQENPSAIGQSSVSKYPLLKQTHFLSFISLGRKDAGKTPVTIQHIVSKDVYESIKRYDFKHPLYIFKDELDHNILPESLAQDIKTHMGIRLEDDENILVDTVKLTATELPQQRCDQVVMLKDGCYYGLIGDAALALSFFKGMNKGLPLATTFAEEIAAHWQEIAARQEGALVAYAQFYDKYASKAIQGGHETEFSIKALNASVHAMAWSPIQLTYYTNAEMAQYHRRFYLAAQLSHFYLNVQEGEQDVSMTTLHDWLTEQLTSGSEILQGKLNKILSTVTDVKLSHALQRLSKVDQSALDIYEKAFLMLAISKVCTLVDTPTAENAQLVQELLIHLKTPKPGFSHVLSAILELILGIVAVGLGVTTLVATAGGSSPWSYIAIGAGVLAAAHGIFQLQRNMQGNSETYLATDEIARCFTFEATVQ